MTVQLIFAFVVLALILGAALEECRARVLDDHDPLERPGNDVDWGNDGSRSQQNARHLAPAQRLRAGGTEGDLVA